MIAITTPSTTVLAAPHLRPAAGQPGSLLEQFCSISLFLADDSRELDRAAAWDRARAAAMPHATVVAAEEMDAE
jgi:hypothetical protein